MASSRLTVHPAEELLPDRVFSDVCVVTDSDLLSQVTQLIFATVGRTLRLGFDGAEECTVRLRRGNSFAYVPAAGSSRTGHL